MTTQPRQVEHDIVIAADPDTVHELIRDVSSWPRIFPPTVHVERHDLGADDAGRPVERMLIWAIANDQVKHWTSIRTLDGASRRIDFRQEVSSPPVTSMSGAWVLDAADGGCRVRLLHEYTAVDDDGLAWVDAAVDSNSRSELAALKRNVEHVLDSEDRLLSFVDSVDVAGEAEDVFEFLDEAGRWSERLPHVAEVRLVEDAPGLQELSMDTLTKDGSTHTTTSIRVCQPHTSIVYKQTTLPLLMTLHTGRWDIAVTDTGVRVSSQHTVEINEDTITQVLGPDAGLAEARAFVRTALSGNSTATLQHAKRFAESRALVGQS